MAGIVAMAMAVMVAMVRAVEEVIWPVVVSGYMLKPE